MITKNADTYINDIFNLYKYNFENDNFIKDEVCLDRKNKIYFFNIVEKKLKKIIIKHITNNYFSIHIIL